MCSSIGGSLSHSLNTGLNLLHPLEGLLVVQGRKVVDSLLGRHLKIGPSRVSDSGHISEINVSFAVLLVNVVISELVFDAIEDEPALFPVFEKGSLFVEVSLVGDVVNVGGFIVNEDRF